MEERNPGNKHEKIAEKKGTNKGYDPLKDVIEKGEKKLRHARKGKEYKRAGEQGISKADNGPVLSQCAGSERKPPRSQHSTRGCVIDPT